MSDTKEISSSNPLKRRKKFKVSDYTALFAIVVLLIVFSVLRPENFPTRTNMVTILRSISVTTVLASGLTFTMSIGGLDLSAGNMASMSGYFCASFILWYGMNQYLAIGLTIILTMMLTLITMFLIIKCHIPELLATCAMMFFLEGLGLTYAGGSAISQGLPRPSGKPAEGVFSNSFKAMGTSPTIIIIMIIVVIFAYVALNHTKYGRYIYAVGGNKTAAKLSGINIERYRLYTGMVAAAIIALAGVLVVARNTSAQVSGAASYQMPAMSAVFIGQSVLGVRKPNPFGTLVGATLVGILDNGLVMLSVPYYALNMIKGAVLGIALIAAYANTKTD
ncbi:MAG: ABC transporter permease [Oscillospiraceae bacterium]|nr:ABC transporter permease [Oscillospiraceae bacterium]